MEIEEIKKVKNKYDIIGNDPRFLEAINKAVQVAPTDLSILIQGESGVGKDVFSRIVHDNSLRKHNKLVAVNCGAIPEGTIESELFGHLKGSFTGADRDRKGYFEEADHGTIFLDEVGELPLSTQVKLLRVLENGEIIPVGSATPRKVDVRVVAATNVDIEKNVRSGRFREDLYYRLNQVSVNIPPLRERKEDIVLLFRKFSSDIATKYKMDPIVLTEDGKNYLSNYPWYGNIRELRNITQQIAVVEKERAISRSILLDYLKYVPEETLPEVRKGEAQGSEISDRQLLLRALTMGQMISEMRNEINQLKQAIAQLAQGLPVNPDNILAKRTNDRYHGENEPLNLLVPREDEPPMDETATGEDVFNDAEVVEDESNLNLRERERLSIVKALERHNGKRKDAADDLGIAVRTLYRKIKEYDIE